MTGIISKVFNLLNENAVVVKFQDPKNKPSEVSEKIGQKIIYILENILKKEEVEYFSFTQSNNGIFAFITKKPIKGIIQENFDREEFAIEEETIKNGTETFFKYVIKIKDISRTFKKNFCDSVKKFFERTKLLLSIEGDSVHILTDAKNEADVKNKLRKNSILILSIKDESKIYNNYLEEFIRDVKIISKKDPIGFEKFIILVKFSEKFVEEMNLLLRQRHSISASFSINEKTYNTIEISENSLAGRDFVFFVVSSLREAKEIGERILNPQDTFQILESQSLENKNFKTVRAIFFAILILVFALFLLFEKRRWLIIARLLSIFLSFVLIGNCPSSLMNFDFVLSTAVILIVSSIISIEKATAKNISMTSIVCIVSIIAERILIYNSFFMESYLLNNIFFSSLILLSTSFILSSLSQQKDQR